jgi:hypothetical protein
MKCEFWRKRTSLARAATFLLRLEPIERLRFWFESRRTIQPAHAWRVGYRPLVLSAMRVANLLCRPAAFIEQDTLREGRVLKRPCFFKRLRSLHTAWHCSCLFEGHQGVGFQIELGQAIICLVAHVANPDSANRHLSVQFSTLKRATIAKLDLST